jgi:tRNA-2-methylthio-N6-dimethylallyladenosine synthase
MPSVYLKTYGCQMNERDTEAVAAQLITRGYTLAGSEAAADVVLLNTCSVRDLAEQKALGKMQAIIGESRRARPGQIHGFLGCMAQSRGAELLADVPGVNLVVGTQKLHRTGEYLDDLLARRQERIVDTDPEAGSQSAVKEHLILTDPPTASSRPMQVSAFVSIMQGCNQHCTFCIVPSTRGGERSRPIPEIVAECRQLADRGVREITLLGQIVNSYGRRDYPVVQGRSPFVQLLEAVHEIEGLHRIRFTSPHPKGYGEDLVAAYGLWPKLVESAHVPLQSGSDRILKQMHRGYTRERYLDLVNRLRQVRPGMGISTDIIVGFPGETEADFAETVSLCDEVQFDMVYLFKYSPRRDTPAAAMPDPVPEAVIEQRHRMLLERTNDQSRRRYEALVGRQLQILVEGPSRKNATRSEGRTRCNKIVVFPGADRHRGELLDVRIERVGTFTLYGDPAVVNLGPEDGDVGLGVVERSERVDGPVA